MREKVCIVGMLDSVHLAKWLENFKDSGIDFVIFPSKKFKHLHPILYKLTDSKDSSSYRLYSRFVPRVLQGYFAYLLFDSYPPIGNIVRCWILNKIIKRRSIPIVHALEFQGAGYLINSMIDKYGEKKFKLIVTNYGSDIYFYRKYESHKAKIMELLSKADFYSAECIRDYNLAADLGFKGISLPCFPNAGGFDLEVFKDFKPASLRKSVLVKCYGGTFGRGDLCVEVTKDLLKRYSEIDIFFYSVTADILDEVKNLSMKYPERVKYSTVSKPLPQSELLRLFTEARVYLGLSESDGISTSFLNALVSGAYPIQSGTSCANEWVGRGASASIVQLEIIEITLAIEEAIKNDYLVDEAQFSNWSVAKLELDKNIMAAAVQLFYK